MMKALILKVQANETMAQLDSVTQSSLKQTLSSLEKTLDITCDAATTISKDSSSEIKSDIDFVSSEILRLTCSVVRD